MDRDRVNEILYDVIDKFYRTETETAIRAVIDLTSYDTYRRMISRLKRLDGGTESEYIKGFNAGARAIIKIYEDCFPDDDEDEE